MLDLFQCFLSIFQTDNGLLVAGNAVNEKLIEFDGIFEFKGSAFAFHLGNNGVEFFGCTFQDTLSDGNEVLGRQGFRLAY